MSSTRVEQFKIKVRLERVNLHTLQMTYVEDLYRKAEITKDERYEMLEVLQQEWL
jgi:hypothetical protein